VEGGEGQQGQGRNCRLCSVGHFWWWYGGASIVLVEGKGCISKQQWNYIMWSEMRGDGRERFGIIIIYVSINILPGTGKISFVCLESYFSPLPPPPPNPCFAKQAQLRAGQLFHIS